MGLKNIKAPRGNQLSCKGWQQEAALRMLLNNLDADDELVTMTLHENSVSQIDSCQYDPSEEDSCIMNEALDEDDYYLCVSSESTDYTIDYEERGESCGCCYR